MVPKMRLRSFWAVGLAGVLVAAGGCGSNDKIVAPPVEEPGDNAPPVTPGGLQAGKPTRNGFTLFWSESTEADVVGYRVYRYDPSPDRTDPYVLLNPDQLVSSPRYTYGREASEQVVYLSVTAIDAQSLESPRSQPVGVDLEASSSLPVDRDPAVEGGPGGGQNPTSPTDGSGRPGKERSDRL